MNTIERIKFFIDYFNNKNNIFYEYKNNGFNCNKIKYSSTILEFVNFCHEINLIDYNYKQTINGYYKNYNKLYELIDISDVTLTKAILTYYIKEEQFCTGLIASAIYYHVFEKGLNKLLPYLAWDKILDGFNNNNILEIETLPNIRTECLWFSAQKKGNSIFIDCAQRNSPSCKFTKKRKLIFRDFQKVYFLYLKTERNEVISSYEKKSAINKTYFYALIYNFL